MTKQERLEFLRDLFNLRNEMKQTRLERVEKTEAMSVKMQNRLIDKLHLKIKQYDRGNMLTHIDIPETINAGDLGELVFRLDKEKGTIRILKRIYSSKNDEEKENETRRK